LRLTAGQEVVMTASNDIVCRKTLILYLRET
jgi:hypothetical protein